MATTFTKLNWEEFEAAYKPQSNHISNREEFNGWLFETYGEDDAYISELAAKEPNRIWTIMDDDNGNLCIGNGWHYVNRQGYIVCAIPFEDNDEIFVQDDDDIN